MTMNTEQVNEYRVVCVDFGLDGHQLHKWTKLTEGRALQSVIDADHAAEVSPGGFYNRTCAPYRAQSRPITEWSDV